MRKDDSQAQSASHSVRAKMRMNLISIFVLCITIVVVGCSDTDKVLTVDIGDAIESETKTFLIKCKGSCKDINATVKVEAGDPDISASEYEPPKIGNDSMIEVSCSTVGGGDPGKPCIFPFKFRGVINRECTLEGSSDGIPWCSTLTDENRTHVSGQGKWGHCDPECLQTTIVNEPSIEVSCSTVGGGDPGKPCIFPFKFHGVINKECTLEGSGDGIPWCSTLTDENGTHVSGQGKWGHCDPECLQTTIVGEPSSEKMCWLKHKSKFKMTASCSQMSTKTSGSFYVTILASQRGYKQGNLTVSGINPEEIKDPCFTLPDEDNSPRLCIFPIVKDGVEYEHCLATEKGQSHWCFTKKSENGTAIERGNCGTSCPLHNGEERCKTESHESCIFPFKFNNVTYYSCTWAYSNIAWCSTKIDSSGVHVGGSKGKCGDGCRIPPQPDVREQKELQLKELEDVLKDIYFGDLGIKRSLIDYDYQLAFICGFSQSRGFEEVKRKVINSTASSYRELCEDPAWNGLRGINERNSNGENASADMSEKFFLRKDGK